MKRFLLSAAMVLAALPVRAAENGGEPVTFAGRSAAQRIPIPARAKPGDVLWESGDSDPTASDFEVVLFQGVLADRGVAFEAALRTGDGWTPWVAAEVERFPNGRFWARVAVSGRKGAVLRLRLLHRSLKTRRSVDLFGMEIVPRAAEPPPARPPRPFEVPVASDTEKPAVRDREAWGAEPAERPYESMLPVRISVHHTGAAQPVSEEDAVQELRIIQRYHQKGRGWIDIGYHFLIDGAGRIWQGRPEGAVGAHVRNKNEGNVGVSLMGSFHPPKDMKPTAEQMRSLFLLARWLVAAYAIDPQTIRGHRDQQATDCPGDTLYARMDDIRREATPPALARAGVAGRVFEILDGASLRSLLRPGPDLRTLRQLDELFIGKGR